MTTISDNAWSVPPERAARPQPVPAAADGGDGFRLFGDDGFTFLDFIDIINPLQHIPVVSTLYRQFTGDDIDPGSRVFGGTLFFGPLGLVAAIGDVMVKDATGKDMGQHVMAFLNEDEAQRPPQVADAAGSAGTVVTDVNAPSSYAVAAAENTESEALDPVTHWAMEEVAYRQSMAAKARPSAESRPEIRERAAAPMPAVAAAYADSRKALVAAGLAEPSPTPALPARYAVDHSAAKSAQMIARHTRQSAAMYAAANYGRGKPSERKETADASPATPPGAAAPLGGWFADAMLKAQDKYRAGAANGDAKLPTTIDVVH